VNTSIVPSESLRRIVSPTGGTVPKQLYFAAFMVAFTLLITISRAELVAAGPYLLALGVLGVATVLAAVFRWEELRPSWGAVVPVIDIVAVALTRDLMRDYAVAVSLLALIPAVWLAARLRRAGVAVATASVTLTITVPSLLRAESIDSLTIANALLLPCTVLQIGLLIVGGLALLDGQNAQLARGLEEKAALHEAAATSEQLLTSIIDSVDVGIVVVDPDGHDVLMNRSQQRIHALATPAGVEDPHEGQLLLRFPGTSTPIPPAQRPVRRAVLQETYSNYVVAAGPPEKGTVFSASARQILDHRGVRSGAVVVFSDVTSHIETVRSQERFVAAVSHELRTPLTSVIGYLELAQDDLDLSRETASYLEVAHRNAEQLLVIVQDLLADQVTRSGTQQLTLRPHRLSEIAGESADSFALQAREQGIALEQEIHASPELPLDAHRVRQAVDNLLSNALKYTGRGGRVTVHTCVRGPDVELNVVDTGIGMSAKEQTALFTDYYRTPTARESAIAGHGIGLSLTRRIVVAHGGQISVRSTPGEGSTFTIRFTAAPHPSADGESARTG
jgi:signal transduction histidine kinase